MRMPGAVIKAEQRWPGIDLKLHCSSRGEYTSSCPWCGGTDRFHVWEEGNYECMADEGHNGCGRKGWVDENERKPVDPLERERRENARRLAELERKVAEHDARLSALERMHQEVPTAEHYHANLDHVPGARAYWCGEGIPDEWQDAYLLGWCARCPTDRDGRASYTLPVWDGEDLVNIRHRLAGAANGDKYRPHMAGLGSQLFNANWLGSDTSGLALSDGSVILGEGEKKSIVAHVHGFPCVAISGARTWKAEWDDLFASCPRIYVCLDPDAQGSATKLARRLGERARLVSLPFKLDEFFFKYHGEAEDLQKWLREARPVNCIGN